MNNEEIKKKICKIIADNYLPKEMPDRLEDYKLYRFKRAADALIAAGIGDVKEAEHRAEVYYEALLSAAAYGDTLPDYYIKQAEKELAEEGKE